MEYERVKDLYLLKLSMLKKAKDNMRILHPLPRVNEIEYAIDDDPHAYYFEQAHNGLFARQALICDALGLTLDDVINDRTIIDSKYRKYTMKKTRTFGGRTRKRYGDRPYSIQQAL